MNKLKILLIIFLLSNLCLTAQIKDTIYNFQVVVLGIKELDNYVFIRTSKKSNEKKLPMKILAFAVEKDKLKDFTSLKLKDFKYASLDTNCYVINGFVFTSSFVHKYIIPFAPEKYLYVLYKTYPYRYSENLNVLDNDVTKCNKKYEYLNIVHRKFILALVYAPLYNRFYGSICPASHRLQGDKAEQGIYFKVLIPILDDE